MLKARDIPLAFAAVTIALLIFAIAWTAPWPQLCPEQNQQAGNTYQANTDSANTSAVATSKPAAEASEAKCDEHAKADWWAIRIGLLTLAVLIGQLIMFWRQLGAMRDGVVDAARSADISKDSLIVGNGAFVFSEDMAWTWHTAPDDLLGDVVSYAFRPIWRNSGNTQTKNMLTMVACELLDEKLAADFDFTATKTPPHPALIGPKSFIRGGSPQDFTVEELEAVAAGKKFLYLWGWTTYQDVFPDTATHITRYCIQLGVGGDLRSRPAPGKPPAFFTFSHHTRGNCADGECVAQGLG